MNTNNKTVVAARWIARILTVLMLLFWGYFIVAHLVGSAAEPSRPLGVKDGVQFGMIVLWLVGLAMAWRWELVGAIIALTAALIGALLNPKAVEPGCGAISSRAALSILLVAEQDFGHTP